MNYVAKARNSTTTSLDGLLSSDMSSYLESFRATSSRPLPSWHGLLAFLREKTSIPMPKDSKRPLFDKIALGLGMPTMKMFRNRDTLDDASKMTLKLLVMSFLKTRNEEELKFLEPIRRELKIARDDLDPSIREWFNMKSVAEQAIIFRSGWMRLPAREGWGDILVRINAKKPDGSIDYFVTRNRNPAPLPEAKQLKFPFWQE